MNEVPTMQQRTLLLTPWYFPQRILRWQDAITMVFLDKVDVIVEYAEVIRSPSCEMRLPAVLRSRSAPRRRERGVRFSRVNVFTRDDFTCQYCGQRFLQRHLSYDHVIPRAAGGRTEWNNIVTACKQCNNVKGSRTCDEAGMWPRAAPVRPRTLPRVGPQIDPASAPSEWRDFLNSRHALRSSTSS